MKYVIYGSPSCTYCNSAKDLLEHKEIEYEYRDVSQNEPWRIFLLDSGHRTVPQIYTEDDIGEGMAWMGHIGGYDALCQHLQGG